MKKLAVIILIALSAHTTAIDAGTKEYFELLNPPEYFSTRLERIHVVGKTSAPLVEVLVNEKVVLQVIVKDSVFHEAISIGFGLNKIEVKPIFSGNDKNSPAGAVVEALSGQGIEKKFRRIYSSYSFHDNQPKDFCLKCHGVEAENMEDSEASVCVECHPDFRKRLDKHTKNDEGTCRVCHKINSNLQVSMANTAPNKNLCFDCHTDKIKSFDQNYVHGPVAGGSCTVCHDPHGSPYEKSLRTPPAVLCYSCHEHLEAALEKDVVHKPFELGQCTECHDPHATSNRWVLIKSSEKLCLACHKKQGTLDRHKHPYNVKPKRKLNTDLKLTDRGLLECLSCHDPHSSNSDHLLKTSRKFTCAGCHSDML